MSTEQSRVNTQNRMVAQTSAHPPSFKVQANKQAFKMKVSIVQRIKNWLGSKLPSYNRYKKESNSSNRSTSQPHIKQLDDFEMIIIDDLTPDNHNRLSINDDSIAENIEKKLMTMLKSKGFSKSQAQYIISNRLKSCKSPHDMENMFDDIPHREIYDKGYHSNKEIQQLLSNKILSLVSKGYDKEHSKQEINLAFNQATDKKEFNDYVDSIPKYTDYKKGYISNTDLEKSKNQASENLSRLGYAKDHSEHIISKKLDEAQSKDDFLKAIKNTPSKIILKQGYKTMEEYDDLRNQYITALQETAGYSHKKAIKFAKQEQESVDSKTHFMSIIKQIQPTLK